MNLKSSNKGSGSVLITINFLVLISKINSQLNPPINCLNNDLYIGLKERRNFVDSQAECVRLGGNLATVPSINEFNFLNSFIDEFHLNFPWVGIHVPNPTPSQSNEISDFAFVDGTDDVDGFVFSAINSPPWFPNPGILQFREVGSDCVHMPKFRNGAVFEVGLNNINCEKKLEAICKFSNGCPSANFCEGNDLISIFSTPSNFFESQLVCERVGGQLAPVSNQALSNKIAGIISNADAAWIGVTGRDENGDMLVSPNELSFIQSNLDTSFFSDVNPGELPWADEEPNESVESCVVINSQGLWEDRPCTDEVIGTACLTENGCLLKEPLEQFDHPFCFENDFYLLQSAVEGKQLQASNCQDNFPVVDSFLTNIVSSAQFSFLRKLALSSVGTFFYVGVTNQNDQGSSDPSDFFFDDGTSDGLHFVQNRNRGEFPWRNVTGSGAFEPNNNAGNEACVALFTVEEVGLIDVQCDSNFGAFCRGPESCPISSCTEDDDLFIFIDTPLTFEDAQKFCSERLNANLARITSEEEHLFVSQLVKQTDVDISGGVWIGVTSGTRSTTDPNDYFFVDDSGSAGEEFFKVGNGNFPWEPVGNEPNILTENCVELTATLNFWNDEDCEQENPFVCRLDAGCITESPTKSPTFSPTLSPTFTPTMSPTLSPTISPSINPTNSPTITFSPTISPTSNPTIINPIDDDEDDLASDSNQTGLNFIFAGIAAAAILVLIAVVYLLIKTKREVNQLKSALKETNSKLGLLLV